MLYSLVITIILFITGPQTFLSPCQARWVEHKNPTVNADTLYQASRCATQSLIDAIKGFCEFFLADHSKLSIRSEFHRTQITAYNQIFSEIFENSDSISKRFLSRNKVPLSAWLTATLLLKDSFHLSAVEFRDALCLRYMKLLLQLPPHVVR